MEKLGRSSKDHCGAPRLKPCLPRTCKTFAWFVSLVIQLRKSAGPARRNDSAGRQVVWVEQLAKERISLHTVINYL